MNRMRILGAVCASLLASSLGAIAACGGTQDSGESHVTTAEAISAANVSIALFDESGVQVGTGAGVMISPKLVLTAGHLIAGKYKWVVTSADGKQTATGKRGLTYDWRTYDSDKAHPRRHDVGVIHLDDAIKLSSYPKLVSDTTASGAQATRVRRGIGGFEQKDATLTKVRSVPNAWLVDGARSETVTTGGAVYDSRGILGVVSGLGTTTGNLYVARIDRLVKWLSPKVACAGAATSVRTYSEPETDKSAEDCDGGTTDSTGSSGSSGGSPSGSTGDSSGNPTGGSGDTCSTNNDGVCNGLCSGAPETDSSSSDSSSSDSSSGDSSSGDSSSGDSNSDSSGSNSDGSTTGTGSGDGSGTGTGTGDSSTTGATGTTGSSGADTTNSQGNTSKPQQSGVGDKGNLHIGPVFWPKANDGVSDSNEACQGADDNADVCPPEASGCKGSDCGGGEPDDTVDYGDCGCGSKKKKSAGSYPR